MNNKRNTRTTHPRQTTRREGALYRLRNPSKQALKNERNPADTAAEIAVLQSRIGRPPRSFV